jgi:hypothetical protein
MRTMPSTPPRTLSAAALVHEPYAVERFADRLRRRVRDLFVMGVVGPATGVLAIVALQYATVLQRPAAPERHAVRLNVPPMVVPVVPDTPMPAPPAVAPPAPAPEPPGLAAADFGSITPTPDVRHMADWVVARHDNRKAPFFIIDKRDARLYVFQPDGTIVGAAPVLLGAARGDDSWPGIGNVPIKQVKSYQRTTAAGRFVTQPGMDLDHKDVVWIDYDAGLAMHRVIDKVRAEHRPERLASPTPLDNRISFGCINVPIPFFDAYVSPVFGKRAGVAYILPEVKTFHEAFEQNAASAPVMASLDAKPKAQADLAER